MSGKWERYIWKNRWNCISRRFVDFTHQSEAQRFVSGSDAFVGLQRLKNL